MPHPDPSLERAHQLARTWSNEAARLVRRARKRKLLTRIFRAFLWMAFTTFVVIPALIATGILLGPRGTEGIIIAPVVLFSLWSFILYWYFGRRTSARKVKKAELARLPAITGEWLDDRRGWLPHTAQATVDRMVEQLEALAPQVEGLSDAHPDAYHVRRLLAEELPELVATYRKVPQALRHKPLYEGKTPEQQLCEGLATLEEQLREIHERLAQDDLHALAVHGRYLDMKYNRKDKL